GAGKSTLLRILMGVETTDGGDYHIFWPHPPERHSSLRDRLGFVSESIEFDLPITMEEFIPYYRQFYHRWDETLFRQLVRDRQFDLHKKFKEYSRGQKMQLCLILALSIRPEILFIDEVTSVLDVSARRYFMQILHEFVGRGGTVILTTNIITEVQHF